MKKTLFPFLALTAFPLCAAHYQKPTPQDFALVPPREPHYKPRVSLNNRLQLATPEEAFIKTKMFLQKAAKKNIRLVELIVSPYGTDWKEIFSQVEFVLGLAAVSQKHPIKAQALLDVDTYSTCLSRGDYSRKDLLDYLIAQKKALTFTRFVGISFSHPIGDLCFERITLAKMARAAGLTCSIRCDENRYRYEKDYLPIIFDRCAPHHVTGTAKVFTRLDFQRKLAQKTMPLEIHPLTDGPDLKELFDAGFPIYLSNPLTSIEEEDYKKTKELGFSDKNLIDMERRAIRSSTFSPEDKGFALGIHPDTQKKLDECCIS